MQPLRLDLKHYETIVAIVDFATMTEAAAHLSTTQSALSHRLAEAERRLGTKLFERGPNRRLTPTRDGFAVHQTASRALQQLGRTEAHIVSSRPAATRTLRIAVGGYDCYHWYPGFVDHVRATNPEVDLDLVVVGDSPGSALASRAVDIVIAPGRPEGDIELRPLFQDELVLVVGPQHRLANVGFVEADDLQNETYLTYNAQPTPGFEYDRFIRPASTYPLLERAPSPVRQFWLAVYFSSFMSALSQGRTRPPPAAQRAVHGLPAAAIERSSRARPRARDEPPRV